MADLEKALELGMRTEEVFFELCYTAEGMGDLELRRAMAKRGLDAFPEDVIFSALWTGKPPADLPA